MKNSAPNLCEVFLEIYGTSEDLRFMEMSRNLRKKYSKYSTTPSEREGSSLKVNQNTRREEFILDRWNGTEMTIYAGSSKPDYRSRADPSWREDQVFARAVRAYEDG